MTHSKCFITIITNILLYSYLKNGTQGIISDLILNIQVRFLMFRNTKPVIIK